MIVCLQIIESGSQLQLQYMVYNYYIVQKTDTCH